MSIGISTNKVKPQMRQTEHWSEKREVTSGYTGLKILFWVFKLLPAFFLRILAFPVGFFYYLFASDIRHVSRKFLNYATAADGTRYFLHPLRHICSFALTLVEKVQAWGGKISFEHIHFQQDDITNLIENLERGNGALLICSHLGNAELLRGLASFNRTGVARTVPVTSVVDFSGTAQFNRLLKEINSDSMTRIISANNIGPDTVTLLQDRIARGELVVIAGDRTSANTRNRFLTYPFLNKPAGFAYGVFFLAAMLNAPTYFVFALRERDCALLPEYDMHVHKSNVTFDCPRKERDARITVLAGQFVSHLERYCRQYPYQWYNFYDFWTPPEDM